LIVSFAVNELWGKALSPEPEKCDALQKVDFADWRTVHHNGGDNLSAMVLFLEPKRSFWVLDLSARIVAATCFLAHHP